SIDSYLKFMLEGMSSQSSVVHFQIEFKVLIQTVMSQEADHSRRIIVILVLGWFHGLRLDQESPGETLLTAIISGHGDELGQMFRFPFHIRIKERHIAFPTTPEHVVFAAQSNGGINGVLYLSSSIGYHIKIWIGRSTVHVAGIAE